jgi:NitT/TauT family transport system substrate-binding protein
MRRRVVLGAALAVPFVRSAAAAETALKFSLAAPFDGSNAAFFLGEQRGWYREAGLACQFDASNGSGEAVTRVGSGVYDLGIADINVMIEFNAKNPASAISDVYMLYYRSPLCVATLAKTGITKAADLAGRKLGAAATDGAYRLFPAYAKAAGFDPAGVAWDMVGLQLREAVLARGDVEAILGFDSTMFYGLQKAAIKPADIKFLYYADAGLDLYGNGIIASPKLIASNPDAVKRFVAVTARAWQAAITDPAAAIAALQTANPLINAALETEKLRWLIKNQLVTPESQADGLGSVRGARLAKAIEVITATYGLANAPTAASIFNPAFLPSTDLRKLPG